ncbi:M81 family metallopeptidase [Sphingopyxis panaciterrae]|uniref:M81 family metallopeptidase n=1 Tax=Sphingopyxis panaciterrae TaxID=363841 RepID=UPI001FBB00DF|nr:M81 family metallopeptidase [Sphingopyxis panaciterrae]
MQMPRTNRRRLRIFVACLAHETNSFSPLPTSLRSFEDDVCYRPPASRGRDKALAFAGYGNAIAIGRDLGHEMIEGPCFWAQPSGPASASTYTMLRDEILARLAKAGEIDIVILHLHGAMIASSTDDCEGDILTRIRKQVGPDVTIGVVLDLHGNMSPQMIESGAVLIGCKEYPHTDFVARTKELYAIVEDVVFDQSRLTTTLRTIPVLSLQGTTEEPMRSVVNALVAAEGRDGIRSVTLMHGFPWADSEHSGASVVIVAQDAEQHVVDGVADTIASRFLSAIQDTPSRRDDVTAALDRAMALRSRLGPIIVADSSDNPGGGAAGDSTFLLRALIERQCDAAAIGMIWDPQAAQIAADAGPGSTLAIRVGGKIGPMSGAPLDLEVEVRSVRSDVSQRFFSDIPNSPLGLTAALRIGSIDIIVNSIRQQVLSPECFTELGVDLKSKSVVVVKSSQHFRANFDSIAASTIYCNAPGTLSVDLGQMPYRNLRLSQCADGFFTDKSPRHYDRLHSRASPLQRP